MKSAHHQQYLARNIVGVVQDEVRAPVSAIVVVGSIDPGEGEDIIPVQRRAFGLELALTTSNLLALLASAAIPLSCLTH